MSATNKTHTPSEQTKLMVITKALAGQITNGQASTMLTLSVRQVQRLKKSVKAYGEKAVVHKLKGRTSNHHINQYIKQEVLRVVQERYADFKPGFATEKLQEHHGVKISDETMRLWMIAQGLWKSHPQKKITFRSWRPRKESFGELEQFDGSYHDWFEKRYLDEQGEPIETCLLATIDDATGCITHALFTKNEGIRAVFQFWLSYIQKHGKPLSIYLDKFSTYKINHKNAVDNKELMTQFERATKNLDILLISAHSPQAKGRVERLFLTLQDRLVKELRLVQINSPQEANRFLEASFIPQFNERFSVSPRREGNLHRPCTTIDQKNLHRIFSLQSERKVHNDFTIHFKNNWYQLGELQPTTIRPKETILVEEWLDKTVHFSFKGWYLTYTLLPERPQKVKSTPAILTTHKLIWKPPANHPWRKPYKVRS